jgi:tetratricopeptide (TPR) repeat protein
MRPVEYFVVENNAFACSQCVVMGQYRGKEVLTVDDATSQARSHLQMLQREAQKIASEMAQSEVELDRELSQIAGSEARLNAQRQIDQIRREADQKIAQIQQDLDAQERKLKDSIIDSRSATRSLLEEAQQLAESFESAILLKQPNDVLTALMKFRNSSILDNLKERTAQMKLQRSGSRSSSIAAIPKAPDFLSQVPHDAVPDAPRELSIGAPSATNGPPNSSSLFAKFMSLKSQNQRLSSFADPVAQVAPVQEPSKGRVALESPSLSSGLLRSDVDAGKGTKEQMTRGWAEFRRGDRAAAKNTWTEVFERYPNTSVGARARAYISEAIDRNYSEASSWYEKALRIDPKDCMTLYNYGVLLESALNKKREALQLFIAAHQLGDHTAGRRAQLLQQQLQLE